MSTELQHVQKSVGQFLLANKSKIATALPRHLTPDRMLSIVMTEIRKNPDLAKCNQQSLISAVIQCSQLGLEPGSALGHAYLIPFGNKKQGTTDCQFMVGYRGMIDLARRSKQVVSLSAHVVFENDEFEFEYGLNEKLKHIPTQGEQGHMLGAYAIAVLKDGGHQIEVMWKREIDKIRDESLRKIFNENAKKYSPWVTAYEEMCKKTVIRRLFKYLPVSIEIQKAVTLDESAERGEQDNSFVIDIEPEHVQQQSKAEEIAEKLNKRNGKPAATENQESNGETMSDSELANTILESLKTSETIEDLDLAMDLARQLPENMLKMVKNAYNGRKEVLQVMHGVVS